MHRLFIYIQYFSKGTVKNLQCRPPRFDPWVRKISWRREWQPTPVFLPGGFHGQRSLVGYSPWGCTRVGHYFTISAQHTQTHTHTISICLATHTLIAIMKGTCAVQTAVHMEGGHHPPLNPVTPYRLGGSLASVGVNCLLHRCFLLLVKSLVISFFNHASHSKHQGSTLSF